jgi:PucR-like helix-turn-helix protein
MVTSSRPQRDEVPSPSGLAQASITATADGLSVVVSAALDEFGARVRGEIPDLLAEVSDLLRSRSPDFATYIDENSPSVADVAMLFVQRLVETARRALVNLDNSPREAEPALKRAFEEVGRLQWAVGRDVSELLSAYRDGARIAWRYVSTAASRLDLPSNVLAAFGDEVLVFVDQLASASVKGYVEHQSGSRGDREQYRRELANLLLSKGCDISALRSVAERADWVMPAEAALVLIDQADETALAMAERIDHRSLPVRQHQLFGLIVPGPLRPSRKQEIAAALKGVNAVVGQSLPLERIAASVRLPRIAMGLLRRGVLDGNPVFVSDHLDTILVQGEETILDALRFQVLAPIADLRPTTRTRLVVTLRSWLRHMGDRNAVAEELSVHPQTVRYRLGQLREHFGSELDSPRFRAQLLLALEWGADC